MESNNLDSVQSPDDFGGTFRKQSKGDEEEKERIKSITVTEPAWVGDQLTGHRTYHVNCYLGNEDSKVIRRYSNFEALRNKLISVCPQCIIPIIPPKRYSEKMVGDDSDEVRERIRGFQRCLRRISEHPILSTQKAFIDFMKNSDYSTEASSLESTTLEEDTSTMGKWLYSWYETVKNKISGGEGALTFNAKTQLDQDFNSDLQKFRNLLEFLLKLHENSKSVKDLMVQESENCRNISSVIGNLQSSIQQLDTDSAFSLEDDSASNQYEEDKKSEFSEMSTKTDHSQFLKESVEMDESDRINESNIYQLIVDMEEGLDVLLSGIDSIERRIKYKKALEATTKDLYNLDKSLEENERERVMKADREKRLKEAIEKIDKNLRDELSASIKDIENKINNYISKMVAVRKSHLGVQKDQWKKVAVKYSS